MPLYPPATAGVSDHGALTGLADDDHTAYATDAVFDDHSARHEDGGADEISIAALSGTPAAVTDHLNDATDAHDASAISFTPDGSIAATNVQAAIVEVRDEAVGGGAHAASHEDGGADEISIAGLAGTPVELTNHLSDATDAHDASAVSFDDTGLTITAADVQTMGEQLDAAISAGGIPATIFDAAGDIIVASAADTAVRLAIGAAGGALSRVNGAVAWNSGTSFPTAATGDRYWRTDLGLECYYDGTRWLSVAEYTVPWTARILLGFTVSSNVAHAPVDDTHDIYVTKIEVVSFVVTTNTGANYWTVHVDKTPPTGAGTSLGSTTTAADTANTWTSHQITVNAVVVRASFPALALIVDVTAGAPGAFYGGATVKYRLVVT